jgi:hypothetical protein
MMNTASRRAIWLGLAGREAVVLLIWARAAAVTCEIAGSPAEGALCDPSVACEAERRPAMTGVCGYTVPANSWESLIRATSTSNLFSIPFAATTDPAKRFIASHRS